MERKVFMELKNFQAPNFIRYIAVCQQINSTVQYGKETTAKKNWIRGCVYQYTHPASHLHRSSTWQNRKAARVRNHIPIQPQQ